MHIMKRRILYSLLITATLGLSSCESFLSENPKDQITEEQAYQNSTLLYLNTVASLYTQVGANGGGAGLQGTDRGLYDLNTFTTDEAMLPTRGGDWYDGGLWQNLFLHNWGTKNDLVKGSWDYLYKVIAQTNQSLDKLKEILENNPENISVPKYISEVRAFRAMYYYYLLDMFARVPLVTSSSVAMEDVVQSERSAVFNFVRTELEESVEDLSDAHSNLTGEYYGRITKPVAYFLLAKLALNAEVYADDNWTDGTKLDGKNIKFTVDGTEMNAWEATIAYCDKIAGLGYKLEPKFESNFSLKNESSVENIFTIPMDANLYNSPSAFISEAAITFSEDAPPATAAKANEYKVKFFIIRISFYKLFLSCILPPPQQFHRVRHFLIQGF